MPRHYFEPVQADRANCYSSRTSRQDALNQPFSDGQFDLVWSMESGEHMPDKAMFVNELVRVAAPGGTIIIVTWCHRDLGPSEESLQPWEKNLLKRICDAYYLPEWCSVSDYVKLLQSLSFQTIGLNMLRHLAGGDTLRHDMEGLHIATTKRIKNHKRRAGDAVDDRRLPEGGDQVLHHYLQETTSVIPPFDAL
ncbi:Intracellular protein transport protein USO1 isoform 1 [Hibiscus syriacus]|uniref:Intracellular protein transport protein USO1 isoform 1 n=1 Tax=Hibiscus syriacus TaxID=106335 RepID=A0A6A3CLH0_HIBSY|nr:Intracellular protein transport protein USO1 isoform 1 [Hibiscus syriacus]